MSETSRLFIETEAKAAAAAQLIVARLRERRQTLALAESCTAGLVSDLIVRISGASAVLWGSFVCYSLLAKRQMLGINSRLLETYGAVSGETVREMAIRAAELAEADIAAAVSGLAGPQGDGSGIPVGTVWVATALRPEGGILREEFSRSEKQLLFAGTRAEVRIQAAAAVLEEVAAALCC